NHAVIVGALECVADRSDQLRGVSERDRSALQARGEGRTLYKFLDQVKCPVLGLPGLVNSDDPRVLELGGASCLAQKPRGVFRAREVASPRNLDRDQPSQFGVASAKDIAK